MRHILGLACAAGLAGCAGPELVDRKVVASNVPVRFNYRSLMNDQAEYQGADQPRTGTAIRRASFFGSNEFAIFDHVETFGEVVIPSQPTRIRVHAFLEDDEKIEWGGSGEIRGVRQTSWQGFMLPDKSLASSGCSGACAST